MNITGKLSIGLVVLLIASVAGGAGSDRVIWVDFDMKDIPEPKEREVGYYEAFFAAQMTEQWKQAVDIPRWVRAAVGEKKDAANVNAVDEVPNSSWYTNRHHLRRMKAEDLVRGPNQREAPDLTNATVTRAKMEGVTPGLQVKDRRGDSYLIKFDNAKFPELQSGAEVISTKILYAAGYNVPENYISYINPQQLQFGEIEVSESGKKRPFTHEDLQGMLKDAARRPDGTYRVLASKILPGKPKGPFAQVGMRLDDPNDLIPHEHRRELRALRVIASWINHWDAKETNTLDMYVEEDGRKFLRHYLIDFGSTLGAGKNPLEYYHGRELVFDGLNMMKELFTLGFYVTPDEKEGKLILPEVGMFTSEDFDPEQWISSFPVIPFDNMTDEDAYWATRIILSFTDSELLGIVKSAQYTNPKATEYIHKTLLERRRIIAAHWMDEVNPLANFEVVPPDRPGTLTLRFDDLMVKHGLASPGSAEYQYEIRTRDGRTEKKHTSQPSITMESRPGSLMEIVIRTVREDDRSEPVRVFLQPTAERAVITRIARG